MATVTIKKTINGQRVHVAFMAAALMDRRYDYCAALENYQDGDRIGWGRTPKAAVRNLVEAVNNGSVVG